MRLVLTVFIRIFELCNSYKKRCNQIVHSALWIISKVNGGGGRLNSYKSDNELDNWWHIFFIVLQSYAVLIISFTQFCSRVRSIAHIFDQRNKLIENFYCIFTRVEKEQNYNFIFGNFLENYLEIFQGQGIWCKED